MSSSRDRPTDLDSAGTYLGISPEEFGMRFSSSEPDSVDAASRLTYPRSERRAARRQSMAPRRTLEKSIAHLRDELADGEPLTAEDRSLLDRTLADVAALLDEEQSDPSFSDTIYAELQDLAERIEATHPTLAVVVGRIVDSLSQIGI